MKRRVLIIEIWRFFTMQVSYNKKIFQKGRIFLALSTLIILSGCASSGHHVPRQDISAVTPSLSEGKLLSKTSDEKRILFNVTSGDTLSSIFTRAKANQAFFSELSKTDLVKISSIHPGDIVEITTNLKGDIVTMAKTVKGQKNTWIVVDKNILGDFVASKKEMKATYEERYVKGVIDNNFFVAARGLSIEQPVAREFISLMESQIDIPKEKKKGDTFKISYRQMYLNNRPVGEPIIAGATYEQTMTLKRYTAFRFRDSTGNIDYYDINGNAIRGSGFDLHPMKQYSRISSKFNPRRRHPVTGRVRPHNGTDYAARTGTPIYASSDGRISYKGYQRGFGNLIKISHSGGIETLYAHMSRFGKNVSSGSKVERGQLIGYVGSTGMVTGPHLHYELHIAGRPVDSLVEKKRLAGGIKLEGKDLVTFRRETASVYRRMASLNTNEDTYITQAWDVESNNVLL
jgi:murein DD-endopeptidase MepM/ murein hydrolase activator NlpD